MNQLILQDFILKQENLNSKIQTSTDITYSLVSILYLLIFLKISTLNKISKLNTKNFNLSNQLEETQKVNEDLTSKIENLTLEIKNLQTTLHSESEFFLWKVLVISFFSSLSFFIFGYCLYNLSLSQNNKKNISEDEEEIINDIDIRTPNNASTNNLTGEIKLIKSKQKSSKKKKKENFGKKIKSEEKIGIRRFSHALTSLEKENVRKRSSSVEEKTFMWAFSPKQISRYIMNKIL